MAFDKEITIHVGIKAQEYNSGVAQAAKSTHTLTDAAKEASKEIDKLEKEAQDAAKAVEKLGNESAKPKRGKGAARQIADDAADAAKAAEAAAKAQARLSSEADKALAKAERAAKQAQKAADKELARIKSLYVDNYAASGGIRFNGSADALAAQAGRIARTKRETEIARVRALYTDDWASSMPSGAVRLSGSFSALAGQAGRIRAADPRLANDLKVQAGRQMVSPVGWSQGTSSNNVKDIVADLQKLTATSRPAWEAVTRVGLASQNSARYIRHSGREISYTAEEMRKYARAASATQAPVDGAAGGATRAQVAMRNLREAARNVAGVFQSQVTPALAAPARGLADIAREAANAPLPLRGVGIALAGIAVAALPIGILVDKLGQFGIKAIQTSENLNQLRGSIGAIVAANETVTDSSGKVIEGVEKIKAVQKQVSGVFKQIQLDAMTTSDTTEGLIKKFSMALAPGFQQNWDLDKTRQFTKAASISMGVLNIPKEQASSEIRQVLTGEELDNSQLAKALGITKKADWTKLAEGGKLFENLMERMKDFVAAGDLASKSLTGVLSAMDDFSQRLYNLAGQEATKTLAEGFGEVMRMVQNADGTVTPLGQNLIDLAEISGFYVNRVAKDFIWLAKKIAEAGEIAADVARTFQISTIRDEVGTEQNDSIKAIASQMITVNGKKMTVKEAINRRAANERLIARATNPREMNPVDSAAADAAARENGAINNGLAPWKLRLSQLQDPGYLEEEVTRRTNSLFNTYDDEQSTDGLEFTRRVRPKSGSGTTKKDPRIAKLTKAMRNEIQIADSKELGFSAQIAIFDKYIPKLRAIKGAEDEVADAITNRTVAVNNLSKKMKAISRDQAQENEAVNKINGASALKLANAYEERELDLIKTAANLKLSALQSRYDAGLIDTKAYYKERINIQTKMLGEETETERRALERRRSFLQNDLNKELVKPLGKPGARQAGDRDPTKIAEYNADIKEIDDQLGGLKRRETQGTGNIVFSNELEQRDALRQRMRSAFAGGISDIFSGLNIPLADGVSDSFAAGIERSLQGSELGGKLDTFFGDGLTSNLVIGAAKTLAAVISESIAKDLRNRELARSVYTQIGQVSNRGNGSRAAEQIGIDNTIYDLAKEFDKNQPTLIDTILRQSVGMRPAASVNAGPALAKLKKELEDQANENESNRQMGEAQKWQNRGDLSLDQYLKVLQALPVQTQEVLDEIKRVQKEIPKEMAAAIQSAHDEQKGVMDQIARENDTTAGKIAKAWEGAADRFRSAFAKVREDLERAQEAVSIGRQVQAIYGNGSAADNELKDIDERIKILKDQRLNIGRANTSSSMTQNELISQFGKIGVTNTGPNSVEDSKGSLFQAFSSRNFTTDGNTFVEDIGRMMEWIRAGLRVTDGAGRVMSEMDIPRLEAIRSKFVESVTAVNNGNLDASELTKQIEDLTKSKEVPYANIRQGSKDTAKSLGLEVTSARAGLTTSNEDDKAVAYARIDQEIEARKKAYESQGLLGANADKESAKSIKKSLEDLRSLMKQQVDKDSYTEANPLPVRVVDNRPLFANPDSSYFRQRSLALTIAEGAIQVRDSGNPSDTSREIFNQIRQLVPELAPEFDREARLNNNRLTT